MGMHFGLIGRSLQHSFSQQYFTDFFKENGLDHRYSLFEMEDVSSLKDLIHSEKLSGLNVTIPFKKDVIPLMDGVDPVAKEIGAINCIKVNDDGSLKGYNTDHIGFKKSLVPLLGNNQPKALILGSGGASKAIKYVLDQLGTEHQTVSRNSRTLNYQLLTEQLLSAHQLIINCTPLCTYPNVDEAPPIPYSGLTSEHILYDLVYNPSETLFMKRGIEKSASVSNGLEMLRIQAEESWRIWID